MPTTLIFGGSGKVARHLTRILAQQSKPAHTVHSIVRSATHSDDLKALGAQPIVQSIEDSTVAQFAETIRSVKPDFVVWAAGAGGSGGPERTQAVDRDGAIKAIDALAASGISSRRFVMLSAIDTRDRGNKPEPAWYNDADRERSAKSWDAIGGYHEAKLAADRDLVQNNSKRNLQYTIVRPSGLSEDAGTGKVDAGKVRLSQTIPREDVARVIAAVLETDSTIGLAFDVVGGQTSVAEAVQHVGANKVDTFEGYY